MSLYAGYYLTHFRILSGLYCNPRRQWKVLFWLEYFGSEISGSPKVLFCLGYFGSEIYARFYPWVRSRTRRCELTVCVLVIFVVASLNLCVIRVGGVIYAAQLSLFCIVYPFIRPSYIRGKSRIAPLVFFRTSRMFFEYDYSTQLQWEHSLSPLRRASLVFYNNI